VTGKAVTVKLTTVGEPGSETGGLEARGSAPRTETTEGRSQDASESEPLIRKALEAFGGQLIR
jgi:hypothetical protein